MENYRIGIISDTHGLLRDEVIEILKKCDYIIHGGDINTKKVLDTLTNLGELIIVKGNNDKYPWAANLLKDTYFVINGIRFYLVHNRCHAPKNLQDLDIVIFGHSHKYLCEKKDGLLWLNPGSCGPNRFHNPVTMAVMTITGNHYQIKKIEFK